jgi:hypothetical protein
MVQTEQLAHSLCRVIYSFYEVYGDYEGVGQRTGGETGIRTLDTLRYTRFPSVRLQPLGHLSALTTTYVKHLPKRHHAWEDHVMSRFTEFTRERQYLHNVSPGTLCWYERQYLANVALSYVNRSQRHSSSVCPPTKGGTSSPGLKEPGQ